MCKCVACIYIYIYLHYYIHTFRLSSFAFEDAFSSDPTRVLVVDLQEQKAIAPSKVAIKHSTNRYVVMTITMSQKAEQLRVKFGSGAMHKLIVRECLAKKCLCITSWRPTALLFYLLYDIAMTNKNHCREHPRVQAKDHPIPFVIAITI